MNIRVGVAVGATRWRPRITVRRAVVLLLAVSLAVPPALTAAPQCSGSTSFYFNGFQTFDLPSYGARAYVTSNVGDPCWGANDGLSSAWSMLATEFSDPDGGYAQSGYTRLTTTPNRYFSQWRRTMAEVPHTVWGGPPASGQTYTTKYLTTIHRVRMWVGSTIYDTTTFDPNTWWDKPWDTQFFGETHRLQDNMPGTAATHAVFSQVQYARTTDGAWVSVPSSKASWFAEGPRYHNCCSSTTLFGIWTDPLN